MVFEEKQTMIRQWWITIPLLIPLAVVISAWMGATDDKAKAEIISSLWVVLAVDAAVVLLLAAMRLRSRIDRDGLSYSYLPFVRKRQYNWQEIEKIWVRKYKPISEYGGWGIKAINKGKNGIAYNVWGNKGLQIQLKGGKKILLGTQKADEMAAFLRRLKEKYSLAQIEEPQF